MSEKQQRRSALITGVAGQDGSYLAEFLIAKGYCVHGIVRRTSSISTNRIDHLCADLPDGEEPRFVLHHGDILDSASIRRVLRTVKPDEVYNLAAQSHVFISFEQAEFTANVVGMGTLRLLEALRDMIQETGHDVRFYQAGSSEMFGSAPAPQNEASPFQPRSPYAVSKLTAHWHTVVHRDAYGLFACNGILFNHESPRRGENFVTRKISRAVGRIKAGIQDKLYLGDLDARRDWGFAGDYVEAMWLMLQQEQPGDYVVATGRDHSVGDFLELAFKKANLDWRKYVELDPQFLRPLEVEQLRGDASKCQTELGWSPRTPFEDIVSMMVDHDIKLAERER